MKRTNLSSAATIMIVVACVTVPTEGRTINILPQQQDIYAHCSEYVLNVNPSVYIESVAATFGHTQTAQRHPRSPLVVMCKNYKPAVCAQTSEFACGRAPWTQNPVGRPPEWVSRLCRTTNTLIVPGTLERWSCHDRAAVPHYQDVDVLGFYLADWEEVLPPGSGDNSAFVSPIEFSALSASFFDPGYRQSEDRQHLGLDIPAPPGTDVRSPVDGKVVYNHTGPEVSADRSFLIIRDRATGMEHVLGHISSAVQPGIAGEVRRGATIGTVKQWLTTSGASNSHVHWGLNTSWVPRTVENGPGGSWGWGRAPASATLEMAEVRGWIDPSVVSAGAYNSLTAQLSTQPSRHSPRYGMCGIGQNECDRRMEVEYRAARRDIDQLVLDAIGVRRSG